jgi:hypothetical protein
MVCRKSQIRDFKFQKSSENVDSRVPVEKIYA